MQADHSGLSGAEIIAHVLCDFTSGPIFHVPGEGILELLDAIEDTGAKDRLVTCRHENAAVTMAGVSGAMRGAPGICLVGRAPGSLNAALAIHSCRTDETPVVLIVGDCCLVDNGRDIMLGDELVNTLSAIAGHAVYCPSLDRLDACFAEAWVASMAPRRGVGVLVIPDEIWKQRKEWLPPGQASWPRVALPDAAVGDCRHVAALMEAARKPVVVVGGGFWSDSENARLREVLDHLGVPAVAAYRFNDILDPDSPSSVGEVGIGADPLLLQELAHADFVILLGARLSELNTFASGSFQGFRLFQKDENRVLVMVSPDQKDFFQAYPVDVAVFGVPSSVLAALRKIEPRLCWSEWRQRLRQMRTNFVQIPETKEGDGPDGRAIIASINAMGTDVAAFAVGAGRYAHLPQRYLRVSRSQRYFGPKSGAMGYGLPAAIAAALTDQHRRAICFAGDGCFAMSGFELATAKLYNANITCIIFNDSRYNAIGTAQTRQFGRPIGVDLSPIDFSGFAASLGVRGVTVRSQAEFDRALQISLSCAGPYLIEIPVHDGKIFESKALAG